MKRLTSFISGCVQRRWGTLLFASVTLCPFTSFGQQFQETDLVANASQTGVKVVDVDPNVVNAWGIARSSAGPWWISDEGKGVSTIYNASGQDAPPVLVTIPSAGQAPAGSPTGIVFNGSSDFEVAPGKPGIFIFATFDGTIAAWNPGVNPTVAIQKVKLPQGSVLTGLTIAEDEGQRMLYATDVREGGIRVFDTNFKPAETKRREFRDNHLPAKFVPFNIQNIGGNLYVSFAEQNQAKTFVNPGANLGAVGVFSPDGKLLFSFERGQWFDAPWGIVQAPSDFGAFSHSILVGQFGSGQIVAFDAVTGRFQGALQDQNGQPIQHDGLWALAFGAGNTNSGPANGLFFNAGPNAGTAGLFGFLTPVAADLTQGNDQ